MKRFGLRLWAAGSAVAVIGVVGIFGLVSDFVDIPGNQAQTGVREGGGGPVIDIQLAQSFDDSCTSPDLEWSDASIPQVFNSGFIVGTGSHDYWSDFFCVRTSPESTQAAFGYSEITDFIETDPECSPGEAAAGDTDCGTSTPGSGEISEFIFWSFYVGPSDCSNMIAPGGGGAPALADGIGSGGISIDSTPECLRFRLFTNANSESTVLDRVQTDQATWNWRIHGSE